jgi:hypothetical protein
MTRLRYGLSVLALSACKSGAEPPGDTVASVAGAGGVTAPAQIGGSGGSIPPTGGDAGEEVAAGGSASAEGYACSGAPVPDPITQRMVSVEEFSTTDFAQFVDNSYTPLVAFRGNTYLVWLDASRRPWVGKISGGEVTTFRLDPNDDYQARDDGHHKFSMGIDRSGTVHIVGDMHHYPDSNVDHLPARYLGGNLMHWVSDRPEDISSFTWVGQDPAHAVPGHGFSYCAFETDLDLDLYLNCRIKVHALGHRTGEMGFGVFRLDGATHVWSALGGLAPDATNRAVIWENNGHAGTFYQGMRGSVRFDCANRMHVATAINDDDAVDGPTDIVYGYSDDEGATFHRANGSLVETLPMRVEAGPNQGDVVLHAAVSIEAYVFFNRSGTPAVSYNLHTGTPSYGVASYSYWDPAQSQWVGPMTAPNPGGSRYKFHVDPSGLMAFISGSRMVRTAGFDAVGQSYGTGYSQYAGVDELGLRETGVFRAMGLSSDQTRMAVVRTTFE